MTITTTRSVRRSSAGSSGRPAPSLGPPHLPGIRLMLEPSRLNCKHTYVVYNSSREEPPMKRLAIYARVSTDQHRRTPAPRIARVRHSASLGAGRVCGRRRERSQGPAAGAGSAPCGLQEAEGGRGSRRPAGSARTERAAPRDVGRQKSLSLITFLRDASSFKFGTHQVTVRSKRVSLMPSLRPQKVSSVRTLWSSTPPPAHRFGGRQHATAFFKSDLLPHCFRRKF